MNIIDSDKPLIMGILNVTSDSFSDGGLFLAPDVAVEHALRMIADGADIIDIGGESTRPGSERVPAEEQKQRILPVLDLLKDQLPDNILVSVDTTLAEVAEAAVGAGATMLNDISAGRDDEGIFAVAVKKNIPIVLMHMQGTPATMQENPQYDNVVMEVRDFLLERAQTAEQAGVKRENIILDPGIGFGKTRRHNLQLLAGLGDIVECGYPVLLGTSRKRFMGAICDMEEFDELVGATCATTALGVRAGVKIFRVHDVRPNRQAADVSWAVKASEV
ncbi:MAG: dihydropteroate synthase [Gammaproteobacteria bacterium]